MDYSIFIPCYNEKEILKDNVWKIFKKLETIGGSFELVLIDDGSIDGTSDICDDLSKNKNIRCFHFDSPSRRENLIKSFRRAKGDVVAFMDADLSTNLSSLNELLDLGGFDLAVGSRYLPDSEIDRTRVRLVISHFFNWLMRFFFGSVLSDHYIGFKSFKKEVILDLLRFTGVGVEGRRMFWDAEMLAWANKRGYSIKEVPVKWVEGDKSALGLSSELSMIPYIIGFFFKYHFSNKF